MARLGAGQIVFQRSDPPRVQQQLAQRLKLAATIANKSTKADIPAPLIEAPAENLSDYKGLDLVDVPAQVDGDLPFLLGTTSGTTGSPKLFVLTQAVAQLRIKHRSHEMPRGPGTRFLLMPSLSYVGRICDALDCLVRGGCLLLTEGNESIGSAFEFATKHRVNFIFGIPVHAHALMQLVKEGALLLPGVKAFRMSSTLIPEALRQQVQEHLTANLYIAFGMLEIGYATIARPELVRKIPGVVGHAFPNAQFEVIDEDDNPLPPGQTGQLRIKSTAMIDGYLDDPAETAACFRDGWFYPGDLGELTPDGALIHYGRADDLMILNGFNIYPAEIENALLQHPAVVEAAAFPVKHQVKGDIPAAAVATNAAVSDDELYAHCRSWLGAKSPVGIMGVDKLPRNAAGKVVKSELQRRFLKLVDRESSSKHGR